MTQMLLFDSVSTPDAPVVNPVGPTGSSSHHNSSPKSSTQNIAAQLEHDGGLNHMGDLARLVLLRYELVAKRRAEMLARRAAK